jgi:hypothetical protein
MKKIVLFFLLAAMSHIAFSQSQIDEKWSKQYYDEKYKALDLMKLIDATKFKPTSKEMRGTDIKYFKAAILQLSDPAIEQMNRDARYLCSIKHDDYFEVWNMFYTKITKDYWDKNCKGLLCLMCLDNTANAK